MEFMREGNANVVILRHRGYKIIFSPLKVSHGDLKMLHKTILSGKERPSH